MDYPVSLDLNEWYGFLLADPRESVRLTVLEEFAASGFPGAFFDLLTRIAAEDTSPACRERAASLIESGVRKDEAEHLAAGFEATPESLRELFAQASPSLRRALLKTAWNPPSQALLDLWRDHLLTESSPDIVATGLSLLTHGSDPRDVVLASTFLGSPSAEVVAAAVDLLFRHDREALKERLADLLAHSDPDIRFHAIRRLAAIDQQEALRFLNAAVEGNEPDSRRRAIRELALLPANATQPSFVRVLGLETQPLLLVIAGRALSEKPTLEMPPLIYDILLVSQGAKKHILNLILRQMVRSITEAGLLKEPAEAYLEQLRKELESRRADLAVSLAMRDLRHPDPDVRTLVLERLSPLARDPRIRKALKTRLKLETVPEIKTKVAAMLEEAPASTSSDQGGSNFSISTREQFAEQREGLFRLLGESADRPLVIRVLKLFQRFGDPCDAARLLPLLKRRNNDPSMVANLVKTIAHLDADAVETVINPLLRDENLAVKAVALEVLVTCDKEGALGHLVAMLSSPSAAVRRKGLSILPLFDGVSVEPLLLKVLSDDPDPDLQAQAGFLIASNPTEPGMKAVYRHTHPSGKPVGNEMSELWDTARPAAATFFGRPSETVDAWLALEIAREEAARAAESKAYAFPNVVGIQKKNDAEEERRLEDAWNVSSGQLMAMVGVFAAVFFLSVFLEDFIFGPSGTYRRSLSGTDQPSGKPAPGMIPQPSPGLPKAMGPGWKVLPGSWKAVGTTGTTRGP